MSFKKSAVEFLTMIIEGNIDKAFDKFVDMHGKHHNIYFPAGFEELKRAMKQNHDLFPDKNFEIIHALEENEKVAILSKISFNNSNYAINYFFKFENEKIIEMWDFAQEIPDKMVNTNGAF